MTSNFNPLSWIATLFFIGKIQYAGSIIAALIGLLSGVSIIHYLGATILLLVAIATFFIGLFAASLYLKSAGGPDEVVIDEVVGMWIVLLLANAFNYPLSFLVCFVAFISFVIFDLAKPWPIGGIDEYVGGAFGSMLDDAAAGFYAFGGMAIALFFYKALLT